MQIELSGVSIAEEGADEKFCVLGALKVAMTLEGEDRDGVGALRLPDGGNGGRIRRGERARCDALSPGWES
jgi:hypothetical protein